MGTVEAPSKPAVRILCGVALVAGCTLAQQVLLTRLLSAAIYYHFSFLAVSLALLGSGAGAILVYVRPGWFDRADAERVMAQWAAAFAALEVVCPILLVRLDYSYGGTAAHFAVNLGAACLIAAILFIAAGVILILALNSYAAWVGRVYAADLAGAGFGAFAIVPLLRVAPAPVLMVALGIPAALASALYVKPASQERKAGLVL
ncbi:MAG TPA: hypothetical protein VMT58_07545, partial [Candidatus Binataceae bacterium]|nr:hypothetical protein [Candidatus Binataceae bacterium]